MKKMLLIILLVLVFAAPMPKAEALWDIFIVYGKRNNQIEKIICNTFSTPNNAWKRTRVPIQEEFESWSSFEPESNQNGSKRIFQLNEFHYGKHPTYRTLDDLLVEAQKSVELDSSRNFAFEHDGEIIKRKRVLYALNLIATNENSICYEKISRIGEQKQTKKITQNLLGERKEEVVPCEPEVIDETPLKYLLVWTVDLGNSEFRSYVFSIEKQIPSIEEKNYLLQLFHKIEGQIRNVNA